MNDMVMEWIEAADRSSEIADEMMPDADIKRWQRDQLSASGFVVHDKHDKAVARITSDIALSMRLTYAAYLLRNLVEIDRNRASGVPVLRGTNFTIARVLAELANGMTVGKMAREFDLNKEHIQDVLHGMSIQLDRPLSR